MKVNLNSIVQKPYIALIAPIVPAVVETVNSVRTSLSNDNLLSDAYKNEFIASQNIKKIHDYDKYADKKVYIVSGYSGSGKDTILREFLSGNDDYTLSVSYTTRKKRDGEIDGRDYYFITDKEFDKAVKRGDFIEWASFSGNRYGTRWESLKKSLDANEKVILKLDTKGALKIKQIMKNAVLIFITPPKIEDIEERLKRRNTESPEEIRRRMAEIEKESKNSKKYDYIVINDTVPNAVSQLAKILDKS